MATTIRYQPEAPEGRAGQLWKLITTVAVVLSLCSIGQLFIQHGELRNIKTLIARVAIGVAVVFAAYAAGGLLRRRQILRDYLQMPAECESMDVREVPDTDGDVTYRLDLVCRIHTGGATRLVSPRISTVTWRSPFAAEEFATKRIQGRSCLLAVEPFAPERAYLLPLDSREVSFAVLMIALPILFLLVTIAL